MTLDFYNSEETKLLAALTDANPGMPEYEQLLRNLNSLTVVAVNSIDAMERLACYEEDHAEDGLKLIPLTPVEPVKDEPPVPAITFDELKERFTSAAQSGVPVKSIINNLGYNKLSEIPPDRYHDALAALAEAEATS